MEERKMKLFMTILFSVIFAVLVALPGQVSAVSITETSAAIGKDCVASGENSTAMGNSTTASNFASTAMGNGTKATGDTSTAMGQFTEASGSYSTAIGFWNKAGGWFSFAAGRHMKLTSNADCTFVWGYSSDAQTISTANAFLIFPAGTAGKVGIGTKSPNELLEVGGEGRAFFGDGGGYTRKGLLIDGIGVSTAARLEAFDYGSGTGLNLVLNTWGHGNVGIDTTSPGYKLEVNGSAGKPGGGSWSNSSDERLKDITGAYEGGLSEILELRPITFYYKEGNERGLPSDEGYVGFIAQEVREVFPEAVSEGPDGYLDFNMHPVNVAVINAIKALKAENDAVKAESESLRAENAMLKKDIEKIKAILGI
jgi:hypothetical protein